LHISELSHGAVCGNLGLHARASLGAGSVIAGRGVDAWTNRLRASPVRLYAVAECGIAIGAFTAPWLFQIGENALLRLGDAGSAKYLLVSVLYLTVAILP